MDAGGSDPRSSDTLESDARLHLQTKLLVKSHRNLKSQAIDIKYKIYRDNTQWKALVGSSSMFYKKKSMLKELGQ